MYTYGEYTPIDEAGSGGCGEVLLVRKKDSPEKIVYALKTISEFMKSKDDIKTLRNEIDMLRKLNEDPKPFIPTLYASDKYNYQNEDEKCEESKENEIQDEEDIENIQPYYVIDYYSRQILYYYIKYVNNRVNNRETGFSEKHAKVIFKKIVEAIKYCHDKNICHLDIKPSNIMLDKNYEINILDFGYSAEIRDKNKEIKRYTDGKGTGEYVCPEMREGKEFTGVEADIFSLGVILFNLVTACKGFITSDLTDSFYCEIAGDTSGTFEKYWKKLENIRTDLSEDFKNLYIKMVAYKPEDRPTIDQILSSAWLKEINDLNDEQRKNLEAEVKEELNQIYEQRIKTSYDPKIIKVEDILPEHFSTNRGDDDKKIFFPNPDINPKKYPMIG
jgi:serine/threonine protein kinase